MNSKKNSIPSAYHQRTTLGANNSTILGKVNSSSITYNIFDQTATIYLKLSAKDNNYVQIGDIVLNYLSKF